MYLKELPTGQHHPFGFFLAYLLTKHQRIVGYDGLVLYLVMHVGDTFLAGVLEAHVHSLPFAILTSEEGLHTNTMSNSLFQD
jgi:hypothetical protein